MSKQIIIQANTISKSYHDGNRTIDVLNNINFTIARGDCIAIVGPSGSGKSTFLHVLGGLDNPSQGEVLIQGNNWQTLNEKKRCQLRNQYLGFVYQFHHLLPEFSALENVAMPLLLANQSIKKARLQAQELLVQVGLEARIHHKPSELSGGERQRVAIARALVHRPHCLFADEPTGNLDATTAGQIIDLLLRLNEKFKTALVIVTHDKQLADKMDITVSLKAGTLT